MRTMLHTRTANNWLGEGDAFNELVALRFAVHALVEQMTKPGSVERENAENAYRGIRERIEYLHDSFAKIVETKR